MNARNRLFGIILIIISASAFSTLGILARFAYADGLDALTIIALRFLLSAVLLLILLTLRREQFPRGRILIQLIGMGAIGYVGQAFAYLTALKYASPGLVALLLYLYPVFVVILSAVWLHETITRIKVIALGLALTGLALTVGPGGGQLPGILLAISAAAIYSVYIMVGTQVMQKVSAIQSSTVIFLSAGVMSSLLMIVNGAHLPKTESGWIVIVSIVIVATIIPVVTFLAGLQRIGATDAAMLSTFEPVVTVVLAALFLGEIMKPVILLGGGLILLAVILLTRSELRPSAPVQASEDSS